MAQYKFAQIICDECEHEEVDVNLTRLKKDLKKAGWELSKEKDMCPLCIKAPTCEKHDRKMTKKYGGGYYCHSCDKERVKKEMEE